MASIDMSVKADFKAVEKQLNAIQKKQLPFATALALTRTTQTIQKLQVREMERVFDAPKRFTLRGTRVAPAKKTKLESSVEFKDWIPKGTAPDTYLAAQIEGGPRNRKRSERWLQSRRLISSRESLIPSRHARLNKFGNITQGRTTKMLSNLNAQYDRRQNTTDNKKRLYFIATINGRRAVWERYGRGGKSIKPFMIISDKQPRYRSIYDFHGLSKRHAQRLFPRKFDEALKHALATAR
jgi:hypothetical protein